MHYDPQTPIDIVFNQVKDILEYRELDRSLYTHTQKKNIAYNIINKTRKFHDEIKPWNRMNPIQQNWINFKTHFGTAHRELNETGKLTMEDAGYHQANLVNNVVAHMSRLTLTYPPLETAYTQITNCSPTIAPTVQPSPAANDDTNAASNILPHLLTSMQHMHQLLIQTKKKLEGGGGNNRNRNKRRPPTRREETETRQGQLHKPSPDFSNKYFWKYGKCAHQGKACNNKEPKNQDTATLFNKLSGRKYGCTWQGGSKKLMVPNIDNKINLIRYTIKIVVDPPPQPIMAKVDTRET